MSRRLFVVQDVFEIRGRGVVMLPGIVVQEGELFRHGDPIHLKRPDGSVVESQIGSLVLVTPNPGHEVVILIKELTKADIPIGTEVWSA